MKKIVCVMMLFCSFAAAEHAHAWGIGLYFNGGGTNSSVREMQGNLSLDMMTTFYGGGIVYDSAPAKNKLFNYRLNAGFDVITLETFQSMGVNIGGFGISIPDLYRVNLVNTFGLGIYRAADLRFWMGPQVAGHFLFQDDSNLTLYGGGLHAGLAVGLNINIRNSVSIAVDGGFRYGFTIGQGEAFLFGVVSSKRNFVNYGFEGYGSVAVMYRVNDVFEDRGEYILKNRKSDVKKTENRKPDLKPGVDARKETGPGKEKEAESDDESKPGNVEE